MENTMPGIAIGEESKGLITETSIRAGHQMGLLFWQDARGIIEDCTIEGCAMDGVRIMDTCVIEVSRCAVENNGQYGLNFCGTSNGTILACRLQGNTHGPTHTEPGSTVRVDE